MTTVVAYGEQDGQAGDAPLVESESQRQEILNVLREFAAKLEVQAEEQVSKKQVIETRWLDDIRQFYGRYDSDTESKLKKANRSRLFLNLTRQKTNAWERRLADMLFPTDEKNWAINPTPVPDIAVAISRSKTEGATPEQVEAGQQAEAQVEEAKTRASAMQAEIDDQLREASYNIECRKALHDACKLGTGVIKGPIVRARVRRRWQQTPVIDKATGKPAIDPATQKPITEWAMVEVEDPRPGAEWVNPWSLFPDMSATRPGEAEFWFERHLPNRKELKSYAKMPGFLADQVYALAKEEPEHSVPDYFTTLRAITDGDQSGVDKRYRVWEYRGPIERKVLLDMCRCFDSRGLYEAMSDEEENPLEFVQGVVWFCQGRILKFGIHLLDSGDPLYSVFNFEKDETSIFGFGVPYLLRNPQAAANAAWRMMMDNAGLSSGPQIVVNRDVIEPADQSWELTPRKVWYAKPGQQVTQIRAAFEVFNIDDRQGPLSNIVAMARQFADDEAQLPLIAQGDPGAHPGRAGGASGAEKTMGGLAMLMNSVNVIFRGVVKNFDDDMTVPTIRRFYDWNMQFNPKEHIKGDFEVDARGSSVLLVREIQSQNMMVFCLQFAAHPIFGTMMNPYKAFVRLVQSNMLPADEIVKPEEEWKADIAKAAESAPPNPEAIRASTEAAKLNASMQIEQMKAQLAIELALIQRDTALMQLAEKRNMDLDKLQTQLEQIRSNERTFAAEIAVKARQGSGI